MTIKVKTFHCDTLMPHESPTSTAFQKTSYLSQLLQAMYSLLSWTEWLSTWHSEPLLHVTPILNVKQLWHGAFIVNNLAQTLGSANQRASTFSSYQDLLFFQLPSGLCLRKVSLHKSETPSYLRQLSPRHYNITNNLAARRPSTSRILTVIACVPLNEWLYGWAWTGPQYCNCFRDVHRQLRRVFKL